MKTHAEASKLFGVKDRIESVTLTATQFMEERVLAVLADATINGGKITVESNSGFEAFWEYDGEPESINHEEPTE